MSNKDFKNLCDVDKWLRRLYPTGMRSSTDVTIRKVTGFELFNTRPYHNYETWSDGYEVEDDRFRVHREDLDDALLRIAELVNGAKPRIGERKPEDGVRIAPKPRPRA